jgi:shikimate kinase
MERRHVVLVGLSGSGKTTVGRLAARALRSPFADLDALIAERAGKSIARIFTEEGEAAFRRLETLVGAAVLAGPPSVIATGGGYLQDARRRREALAAGLVIYLETQPEEAAARLGPAGDRPLLVGRDTATALLQQLDERAAGYLEAHERVKTAGLSAAEVADRVVELARRRGGW